jgi:hypothetical protein
MFILTTFMSHIVLELNKIVDDAANSNVAAAALLRPLWFAQEDHAAQHVLFGTVIRSIRLFTARPCPDSTTLPANGPAGSSRTSSGISAAAAKRPGQRVSATRKSTASSVQHRVTAHNHGLSEAIRRQRRRPPRQPVAPDSIEQVRAPSKPRTIEPPANPPAELARRPPAPTPQPPNRATPSATAEAS